MASASALPHCKESKKTKEQYIFQRGINPFPRKEDKLNAFAGRPDPVSDDEYLARCRVLRDAIKKAIEDWSCGVLDAYFCLDGIRNDDNYIYGVLGQLTDAGYRFNFTGPGSEQPEEASYVFPHSRYIRVRGR